MQEIIRQGKGTEKQNYRAAVEQMQWQIEEERLNTKIYGYVIPKQSS